MDPSDVDVDDLVLEDDLDEIEEKIENVQTDPEELAGEVAKHLDSSGGLDNEDVQGIADATFQERLEHLIHEDCDTPACNRLRDQLDLDPEADDGGESNGADDDSGADAGDGDGEGNEESGSESSSGDSGGESTETEQSGSSDAPEHAAFPDEL